jgi:peptidoglycan glycosyltransferase
MRQLWVQVIDGPRLAGDAHNPRRAMLATGRGSIVASDGTPLAITRGEIRVYPQSDIIVHAVGYASAQYGTFGLEDAFNSVLAARPIANDPIAQARAVFGGKHAEPRGADVVTTIDIPIQRALMAGLSQHARAAGVVLDPRTGAVLALGSVPVFDPNKLGAQFPKLLVDPAKPLIDRSIDGLYPPGSTFKIITAADALDAGVVTMESKFNDPGGYTIGNFTVKNDEEERTGTQDLTGAFALSSNVDFAMIGVQLGVDRWVDYAHRWGLGDSLSFDLPAAKDHIPRKDTITPSILAQLAFGQADLLVTPMRMAVTGAAIANGGTVPRPYLVRRIAGQETELAVKAEQLAQPISAETAAHVRDMMIQVVKRGTGTAAALPNVTVAGKTGTATNPAGRSHAWFVAFAPAEAPVVAVAIVVENVGYGGTYAAPIARNVLRVALARQRTSAVGNAP